MGYQSVLATPVTYKNLVSCVDLGQRNSTTSPYLHFSTTRSCTPSSSTQCCIYSDSGYRYDYW